MHGGIAGGTDGRMEGGRDWHIDRYVTRQIGR